MEYTNFSGGYTPYLYTRFSAPCALRLGLPSSPIEIYITIGLGISATENEIYITIGLGIFVFVKYT